jgi:energy-coupling factor transport system ATP-binding protein
VTHDQEFSDVLGGTELKLGAPELKLAGQEPGLRNPEVAAP